MAASMVLLALVGAGCGSSTEDDQQELGSDEFYSITMQIDNTTDMAWKLTSSVLGHDGTDGGHWKQRPVDLAANSAITVSGYSAVQGQAIALHYTAVGSALAIQLVAQDPAIGDNNTNGTKGQAPVVVNASVTNSRSMTAKFTIS